MIVSGWVAVYYCNFNKKPMLCETVFYTKEEAKLALAGRLQDTPIGVFRVEKSIEEFEQEIKVKNWRFKF